MTEIHWYIGLRYRTILKEAPSVLPAAQAVKDREEFEAQALKQWEDPSMPVVPPGNARC